MRFTVDSEVFEWSSRAEWFFVALSDEASAELADAPLPPRGFGSVRVRATIGMTSWNTSVFPDSTLGRYVLPLKKSVRTARGISEGDRITGTVDTVDI